MAKSCDVSVPQVVAGTMWMLFQWWASFLVFFPWYTFVLPAFGHKHIGKRKRYTLIREDGSGVVLWRCQWWCQAQTKVVSKEPNAFAAHSGRGPWWKVIDFRGHEHV